MKRALITGVTGQDGSYLAELLLRRDYEVHGAVRSRAGQPADAVESVILHPVELADAGSIARAVLASRPDEIYHLAGQSHVQMSSAVPEYTTDVIALGTLRLLEVVRDHAPKARIFLASSSEIFGQPRSLPQNEDAPLAPLNVYAASKVFAFHLISIYRQSYGLFAASGILFNHESPRRPSTFVTQKIAEAAARISLGLSQSLRLGSLEVRRDWGFAGDYVEAMWLMLQRDEPDDYVIATGMSHSVRQFCEAAFAHVGLDYRRYVIEDPSLIRRNEVPDARGDAAKAKNMLGWTPRIQFNQLVAMMVDAQLIRLQESF